MGSSNFATHSIVARRQQRQQSETLALSRNPIEPDTIAFKKTPTKGPEAKH
jgi:hypothetical protein